MNHSPVEIEAVGVGKVSPRRRPWSALGGAGLLAACVLACSFPALLGAGALGAVVGLGPGAVAGSVLLAGVLGVLLLVSVVGRSRWASGRRAGTACACDDCAC